MRKSNVEHVPPFCSTNAVMTYEQCCLFATGDGTPAHTLTRRAHQPFGYDVHRRSCHRHQGIRGRCCHRLARFPYVEPISVIYLSFIHCVDSRTHLASCRRIVGGEGQEDSQSDWGTHCQSLVPVAISLDTTSQEGITIQDYKNLLRKESQATIERAKLFSKSGKT